MNRLKALVHGLGGRSVSTLGAILLTLLGAVVGSMIQGRLAETLATNVFFLLLLVLLAVMIMIIFQMKIFENVEQMRETLAFSIDYYPGMTEHELLELHRQAAKVIHGAPDDAEIYAVNSYVEVFTDDTDDVSPAVQEAQREYLREYEAKFNTISYHRLIQLRNGELTRSDGTPLSRRITPAYLAHYREIVRFAHDNPRRPIKIEEVEAKLPISFVLIKKGSGGQIIWQMNQHAANSGQPDALKINGIFLVTDPDGLLVRYFMQWFQLLDRGRANPLTESDLREPAPAPGS